jgi:hypothetical protein
MKSTYQWNDNFTVRVSLEGIRRRQLPADDPVIVDLAIDGKGERLVLVSERLGATVFGK